MEQTDSPAPLLAGTCLAFTPVPAQRCYAMDPALNGITTVRILRGGVIDVTGGPDMDVVRSAIREDAVPLKATKDSY